MTGRRRVYTTLAALLTLGLVATACGSSGSGEGRQANATAEPAGDEVVMRLIAFTPKTLQVTPGTTVTWEQQDAGVHTVTSGVVETDPTGQTTTKPNGTFASKRLGSGERFSFTFEEPGTFSYFCEVHPATMQAEITVA